MKTADVLYDIAMDYYDLGKIAKAKGKLTVYKDYLNKAFILSKEAAIKKQQDVEEELWKYVYLRSAAWLAIDCEKWKEAEILALFGLQGTPPPTEANQFKEILKKLGKKRTKQSFKENKKAFSFIGILTSVDIAKSYIVINGNKPTELKIWVTSQDVNDLVKLYWGEAIEGIGIPRKTGGIELQHIQKAA